jgi:hypothetical protein
MRKGTRLTAYIYSLFILLLLLVCSCKKQSSHSDVSLPVTGQLLVINEGNFGWGNASIGLLDTLNWTYTDRVFYKANQRPLGDVLQFATQDQEDIYLVLNHSGEIVAVNPVSFQWERSVKHLTSPRYMYMTEPHKALVTDLYAHQLWWVDLKKGEVEATTPLPGWSEWMASAGNGDIWVCHMQQHKTYLVEVKNKRIKDSTEVKGHIKGIFDTRHGAMLWTAHQDSSLLWNVQSGSWKRVDGVPFVFSHLHYDLDSDQMFGVSNNSIYMKQGTSTFQLWGQIPELVNPYGLSYLHPYIFVTDALDYVQRGNIWAYHIHHHHLKKVQAGPLPKSIMSIYTR